MKIIKLIVSGEIVQLGFEGKDLYIKWGNIPNPMKLGQLREIKALATQPNLSLEGKTVKVPVIIKSMAKGITSYGLMLADKYNNDEFYNDFLKDFKDQDKEGSLRFLGESEQWD